MKHGEIAIVNDSMTLLSLRGNDSYFGDESYYGLRTRDLAELDKKRSKKKSGRISGGVSVEFLEYGLMLWN